LQDRGAEIPFALSAATEQRNDCES
jgi:hypothetical protein